MSLPRRILVTARVKQMRDALMSGEWPSITPLELLELIGSHEQLRAFALAGQNRLRAIDEERARLQSQIEKIARTR